MIPFERHVQLYCQENRLHLHLSFDMPNEYKDANGTYEPTTHMLFINREKLQSLPAYEQLFYLFHELRHALQYTYPERFDPLISRSLSYVIMYDGTCHKLVNGQWKTCRLEGEDDFFSQMYLGQPYEQDANAFAFEKTKECTGDAEGLRELYAFWSPRKHIAPEAYENLFAQIDKAIG